MSTVQVSPPAQGIYVVIIVNKDNLIQSVRFKRSLSSTNSFDRTGSIV